MLVVNPVSGIIELKMLFLYEQQHRVYIDILCRGRGQDHRLWVQAIHLQGKCWGSHQQGPPILTVSHSHYNFIQSACFKTPHIPLTRL